MNLTSVHLVYRHSKKYVVRDVYSKKCFQLLPSRQPYYLLINLTIQAD